MLSAVPSIDPRALTRALLPWQQLATKVDTFFDGVQARHGRLMRCAEGCSDCCGEALSLLPVEAAVVWRGLRGLERSLRRDLRRRASSDGPCVLLHQGRCAVYGQRPLVCRSHGLPLLYSEPERDPRDEVTPARPGSELSWCPLNFQQGAPPPSAVLDATRTYATLAVVDRLFRRTLELPDDLPRIPLRALLLREGLPEWLTA